MKYPYQKLIAASIATTLVASAVAPASAATQSVATKATNAVKAYEKFKVTKSSDASKAASLEKNAIKAVAKLTKKYAKLKASLNKRISNQRKKVNATLAKIDQEAQKTARNALNIVRASLSSITATTPISNIEAQYNTVQALINKVSNKTAKQQLQIQLDQFKREALAKIDSLQPPRIAYVSATNTKTLTISGTKLNKLNGGNLKFNGTPVGSFQPSADGATATVRLSKDLLIAERNILTATIDGQTYSYYVTYDFVTLSAVVQAGTYDNLTSGQQLTILVNGQPSSIDSLVAAGYTVRFSATYLNPDGTEGKDATSSLFANTSTGVLMVNGRASDNKYAVRVTLTNGSVSITSMPATIIIKQLTGSPTVVNDAKLYNQTLGQVQKSSTLYLGEKAYFNQYVLSAGSNYTDLRYELTNALAPIPTLLESKAAFTIQSSRPNVISVDDNNVLKAESIGTATIKITYGSFEKTVTLTVAGAPRKIARVVPDTSSLRAVADGSFKNSVNLTFLDQYGEAIKNINAGDVNAILPNLTGIAPNTSFDLSTDKTNPGIDYSYSSGTGTLTLNGLTKIGEVGTIQFKDKTGAVIGSYYVNTIARSTNPDLFKVDIDRSSLSTDDIINTDMIYTDNSVTYNVSQYTNDNLFISSVPNLKDYKVSFSANNVLVNGNSLILNPTTKEYEYTVTAATGVNSIKLTPLANGTTTFKILNPAGVQVGTTRVVTVNKFVPAITGMNWKTVLPISVAPKDPITYKNILSYIDGQVINKDAANPISADDIITGISLSTPVPNNIRISKATGSVGDIYIDKDENGKYNNQQDIKLGHLELTVSNDALGPWSSKIPTNTNPHPINSITGIKPGLKDSGTLVFTLFNDSNNTNAIATYPITVSIK